MFVVFLTVFLLVFGAINFYLGSRILLWLHFLTPTISTSIFWLIYCLIAIIAIFSQGMPHSKFSKILKKFSNYWIGVFYYLILTVLFIDIIRFILKVTQIQPVFLSTKNGGITIGTFVFLVVVGLVGYGIWNAKQIKMVSYQITIDKPSNLNRLKIVLVSDLHLGHVIGYKQMESMVEKINTLKPDMVVMAGDVFDGSYDAVEKSDKIAACFQSIKSTFGTYAVLGNHDAGKSFTKMVTFFTDAGVKLLQDEVVIIDDTLTIIGRKDRTPIGEQGSKRKPIEELATGVDHSKSIMVLDHQPNGIQDARSIQADLLLSGHTHKGQFTPGNWITKKVFEIDYGHLKTGNLNTIVTSGFGTWGPPMRVTSNNEIVEIDVQFQ
ncbi:MAG: serine/threonine protein phosphatase [Bacillales bacterium]|jgi:predicted MPP superfamily phosphohydrolase|nr:serine/threonine protein phosphatase [Bacillales bacterium]